ncbi:MAG: hypothetical protein IRY92_02505, partial [Dactylosporangium sp.]|nr:hypothetical protein [Dactylosporangium sp.]
MRDKAEPMPAARSGGGDEIETIEAAIVALRRSYRRRAIARLSHRRG